jgi:DNA-binding transcriptional regulator YiaG
MAQPTNQLDYDPASRSRLPPDHDAAVASVLRLRSELGLSRTEFARFLGVSEATVVRWESDRTATEPKGLQAVILSALLEATRKRGHVPMARVVRSCGLDHRVALRAVLDAAD